MDPIILHVDMDAFFASVEVRDDPTLRGKPLIIGALPGERGVVATCSYEARRYGVHSAMNIKDAYRLCPQGVFMHPSYDKYKSVSEQLHAIWNTYASAAETIALDEAYLDVTAKAGSWEGARAIAHTIKQRTKDELGLTCSVGLAYSKTAAKTASEEKKPDGYYEIPTAEAFVTLISDRDVRVLYTVGEKTAQKLNAAGIRTVRDIRRQPELVVHLFGKQGKWITDLASGIDPRPVVPYRAEDAKSIGREITFQEDVTDYGFLVDVLFLLCLCVENRAQRVGLYGKGVSIKLTYSNMRAITRSRLLDSCRSAVTIYHAARQLLELVDKRPVRLIGVSLYNLSSDEDHQISLDGFFEPDYLTDEGYRQKKLQTMKDRYGLDFAAHLPQIFHTETLHKTVEYMRVHA